MIERTNKNSVNITKFSDNQLKKIRKDKSFQILESVFEDLKVKYNLSSSEILRIIEEKTIPKEILIPISIFDNEELSCLETIVKYLKEEFNLRFHEIALLLNRDDRTIWATYNFACKKRKLKFFVKDSKFFIPVSVFTNRKFSVLEAIVSYLKSNFNLRYSEIAVLLNRDERNIWTVYNRYKKKK